MDLRSMQAFIWMLLFGFLIFVPGSTLNAIEGTAVTTTAATAKSTPTAEAEALSIAATINTTAAQTTATAAAETTISTAATATETAVTVTEAVTATTTTTPELLKDSTVVRAHSITQAATPTPITTATTTTTATPTTTSSITIITKRKEEPANDGRKSGILAFGAYQFETELAAIPARITTTTTTTTTAAAAAESTYTIAFTSGTVRSATEAPEVAATGNSLTRRATNVTTTIGTKASLNSATTSHSNNKNNNSNRNSSSSKSNSQSTSTTATASASASGSGRVNSVAGDTTKLQTATTITTALGRTATATTAAPTAAATTTTITTTTTTPPTTTEQVTTIESLAAAAAAQLVATLMPLTAFNEQVDSINNYAGNNNNNNNNNYNKSNYYHNNGQAVSAPQFMSRSSSALGAYQAARPLQRPKIYNSNTDYQSNHNRNDLVYMREQQQLFETLQKQQKQQYAQHSASSQVATPHIVAVHAAAVDGNLIEAEKNAKMAEDKSSQYNQSMATFANNLYANAIANATAADAKELLPTAAANSNSAEIAATTTTTTTTTTTAPVKTTTRRPRPTTTPKPTPAIDDYQTIISQAGTHAYLPCNVKQLVKKPISWLRVRDGHILTVDQTTFIADQRFQSIYVANPERWSLQIKYVQLKDAGTYECQVSTEPKSSAIVTLRIVEPKTELIGEPTRHVKAGSQVKLRCIISQALEPPLFINWFYNQKQIYLHNRKGWRTEIERIELPAEIPTTPTTTTTTTTAATTTTSTAATTTKTTTTANAAGTTNENASAIDVAATMTTATVNAASTAGPSTSAAAGFTGVGVLLHGNATATLLTAAAAMSTTLPAITKTISTTSDAAAAATTTTTATAATTSTMWTTTTAMLAVAEVKQITTASLIIPSVEKQDSGNYTCSPSNSAPKTVVLHVLNGEYSASAITSGVSGNIIIGNCSKWHCHLLQWHSGNMLAILTLLWIIEFALVETIWKCQRRHCNAASTSNTDTTTTVNSISSNNITNTTTCSSANNNSFANVAATLWNNAHTGTLQVSRWHRKWHKNEQHLQSLQFVATARNKCQCNSSNYSSNSNNNNNNRKWHISSISHAAGSHSHNVDAASASVGVDVDVSVAASVQYCWLPHSCHGIRCATGNGNLQLRTISTCTLATQGKT